MLNNLRNKFDPFLDKIGRGFASLGFGPNFWTWMGLILSIISAFMFSLHSPAIGASWYTATFLGSLFLIIAGFFDAVDGAVARASNKTTALGGFLDSVIDKVSEIVVFIGILIGNFTNPVLVLVALGLSLMVSYTRAKADTLNIDLKGKGIAERAERILIIAILGFIPFKDNISVALWLISILAIITVLERLKIVSASFGTNIFSSRTLGDMFRRESKPVQNSSTVSKFNKESASSISQVPKNVKDFLEKTEPDKKDTLESNKSEGIKKNETKILDKSDPNETGRDVARLLLEQESEDKKTTRKQSSPNTSNNKEDIVDTNKDTTNTSSSSSSPNTTK